MDETPVAELQSMSTADTAYDNKFFDSHEARSIQSAQVVVPLVKSLVPFQSVVDIGCGRGAWLSVFSENGATHILGVDGSYVDKRRLLIPASTFLEMDLANVKSALGRFDIAVCLEVGEHLPHRAATPLVDLLCTSAPVVLFSAAIPGQGGTSHINEQWPEYWEKRFRAKEYTRFDAIRPAICKDRRVAPWYRQNAVLYVAREFISTNQAAHDALARHSASDMEFVLSERLERFQTVRGLLTELCSASQRAIRRRLWM